MVTGRVYANRLPHLYQGEVDRAEAAGSTGVTAPGPEFEDLAASGEPLNFVVTQRMELVVASQFSGPPAADHAVLARGDLVLAAGEVSLAVADDFRMVIELNNRSGHYGPDAGCLAVAVEVFQALGFKVPDEVITAYREN